LPLWVVDDSRQSVATWILVRNQYEHSRWEESILAAQARLWFGSVTARNAITCPLRETPTLSIRFAGSIKNFHKISTA
jgi:hypothetical protein